MKQSPLNDLFTLTQVEIDTIKKDIVEQLKSLAQEYGATPSVLQKITEFLLVKNTTVSLEDLVLIGILFKRRLNVTLDPIPPESD